MDDQNECGQVSWRLKSGMAIGGPLYFSSFVFLIPEPMSPGRELGSSFKPGIENMWFFANLAKAGNS